MTDKPDLPDISEIDKRQRYSPIDWVGMSGIHVPTRLVDSIHGEKPINASIQAYVNLENPAARGIHMSRLYLLLEESFAEKSLTPSGLKKALKAFLSSHENLSSNAFIELRFHYSLRRAALKSDNRGWKDYAATITASRTEDNQPVIELSVDIPYSSTCPASAALSRQLIRDNFVEHFKGRDDLAVDEVAAFLASTDGIMATPHSQRSIAQVKVMLTNEQDTLPLTQLIDQVEAALQTPVQTAVKREDEQEFARLNGQNLMFCEDAVRYIKSVLDKDANYRDYWIRTNHLESLHPHDAVAIATKQLAGGYQPLPGAGIS